MRTALFVFEARAVGRDSSACLDRRSLLFARSVPGSGLAATTLRSGPGSRLQLLPVSGAL